MQVRAAGPAGLDGQKGLGWGQSGVTANVISLSSPPPRHPITEPSLGMPEACSTQPSKPFPEKAT